MTCLVIEVINLDSPLTNPERALRYRHLHP